MGTGRNIATDNKRKWCRGVLSIITNDFSIHSLLIPGLGQDKHLRIREETVPKSRSRMKQGLTIEAHLAKAWVAVNIAIHALVRPIEVWSILLSITGFLSSSVCVNTTLWMHHMDTYKSHREKARRELHKNPTNYIDQILEATPLETAIWRPLTSHL